MAAIYRAMILGCGIFAVTSCERQRETRETHVGTTTTTTSTRRIMNDDAAMILTRVRCAHESTCADLGTRARFTTQDACAQELFPETRAIVSTEGCPTGVDDAKLTHCVADIRTQQCEQKRRAIDEVASCKRVELCSTPELSP
ncbi:MAG: hypothetical protein K0S65_4714 [Labilithrix sp.]|nr:hypothetical protein [Labilithrix sp.]